MKAKLLLFFIGLMGLVVSSCEDHFMYDKDVNFRPMAYEAKSDDVIEIDDEYVSTTLSILGIPVSEDQSLVFDEIEKSDWKIITQSAAIYKGDEPLEIDGRLLPIDNDGATLMYIPTNYGYIAVAFGNTKVTYDYMGKEVELKSLNGLYVSVRVNEEVRQNEPVFVQRGNIVFKLFVGYVPVKVHKINFIVYDSSKFDDPPSIEDGEQE